MDTVPIGIRITRRRNICNYMDTIFKLDLKTLIMLITFVAGLAGMYYTLQDRLDDLEHASNHVKSDSVEIQKRLDVVEKKINKLNRKKPNSAVN